MILARGFSRGFHRLKIPKRNEFFVPQYIPKSIPRQEDFNDELLRVITTKWTLSKAKEYTLQIDLQPIHIYENLFYSLSLTSTLPELVDFADFLSKRNIPPSINLALVLCQKSIELGNVKEYKKYFDFIATNWWPLSRQTFSYLYASHMDRLLFIDRYRDVNGFKDPSFVDILGSYRLSSRVMKAQGMDFDGVQYSILITGLSMSGSLKNAMYYYQHFEQLNEPPSRLVIDSLFKGIGYYDPKRKAKIPQLEKKATSRKILDFMLDDVKRHQVIPSLDTLILLLEVCKIHRFRLDTKIRDLGQFLEPNDFQMLERYHWTLFNPTSIAKPRLADKWKQWDTLFKNFDSPVQRLIWLFQDP